jgi:hypothetical protein
MIASNDLHALHGNLSGSTNLLNVLPFESVPSFCFPAQRARNNLVSPRAVLSAGSKGMSHRSAIQEAIIEFVERAASSKLEIDVNRAAIRLASKYSQSGFTIDEICAMVRKQASLQYARTTDSGQSSEVGRFRGNHVAG